MQGYSAMPCVHTADSTLLVLVLQPKTYDMIELEWDLWATDTMRTWKDDDIKKLLDLAEDCLVKACTNLRLDVQVPAAIPRPCSSCIYSHSHVHLSRGILPLPHAVCHIESSCPGQMKCLLRHSLFDKLA